MLDVVVVEDSAFCGELLEFLGGEDVVPVRDVRHDGEVFEGAEVFVEVLADRLEVAVVEAEVGV